MGSIKEYRAWVNSIDEQTIEKFSIKFGYSEPRIAYDHFTNAVKSSRLKERAKRTVLDNLEVWKENKSHTTLFWINQKRALAIREGKSIVGASLVTAATEELPELIQRDDPSTATSSTSSSSTRTLSSRLAGKRSIEQTPNTPNKKQCETTQKVVIAGTSTSEDHDRNHDDHHVHHHGHENEDEDDDPDNSDADHNNIADFLPRSLFDKGENVDQYFFESPVSAWKDIQAFCKKVLDSKFETSCTTAFRRYSRSLLIIAKKTGVEEHVQNCARAAFNMIQQAVENISKRSNGQDVPTGEKFHLYVDLLNNQPLPLDPFDDDFLGSPFDSRSESCSESSLDLTGEIPVPIAVDHLVGPGTLSSQISSNSEDHLISHGCNISYILMRHRRSKVTKSQIIKDDLLLVNFVFTTKQVQDLIPTTVADEVFPPHVPIPPDPLERDFVNDLSTKASISSFKELSSWLQQQPMIEESVVRRAASAFLSDAGLWSEMNWFVKGNGNNEDSFIDNLVKPLCGATFGALEGSSFRWTRDPHRSGKVNDLDARLLQPDYQVSLGRYSFVLGEFKTPTATLQDMDNDFTKLVYMGKKSVDGLFSKEIPCPVVLIHGRGMSVSVYRLELRAEAIYHLQLIGTFRLLSGPYDFPLLLGLAPLIAAQRDRPTTSSSQEKKWLQSGLG
ncbi:hypothetical protein BGW38_004130 [Lunasporangiospora selenospora]|uniref:Uncharacterized protein n=1 Tax=Lunasporangiospora selenospora TaxID=979761 RepID=A0A9P6KC83_9FUNG|nr:hypothetical protein BGW38_004130 [Lunasporangiospora selenospora]